MVKQWTADIVASLHLHQISRRELAAALGVTPQYVTMVLNSKKTSAGIEERMKTAINEIVERRNAEQSA